MKLSKQIIIAVIAAISAIILCSCSRGSMRDAGNSMRNTARRAENYMDNGLNAVTNGIENGANTITGGMYGANSGYSGNAAIGTGGTNYAYDGNATEINPTLRSSSGNMDKNRKTSNTGKINTNRGSADGGISGSKNR